MSDILHSIAAMLDQKDSASKDTSDFYHDVHDGAASGDDESELDQNPVFVPPLQAKIELLKKASDVENVYNDEDTDNNDELSAIKRLTGIKAVIAHEAGSDEPIDV